MVFVSLTATIYSPVFFVFPFFSFHREVYLLSVVRLIASNSGMINKEAYTKAEEASALGAVTRRQPVRIQQTEMI
jgi:hypothetical protein